MSQEIVTYPGFRATCTSTHDWDHAGGPFHWATYTKTDDPAPHALAVREHGYCQTWDEAARKAGIE